MLQISVIIRGVSDLELDCSEIFVLDNCLAYIPRECNKFCLSASNVFLTSGLLTSCEYLLNSYNCYKVKLQLIIKVITLLKNVKNTCLVLLETLDNCNFNFSPTVCSAGSNKYSNCLTAVFHAVSEYGPQYKILTSAKLSTYRNPNKLYVKNTFKSSKKIESSQILNFILIQQTSKLSMDRP